MSNIQFEAWGFEQTSDGPDGLQMERGRDRRVNDIDRRGTGGGEDAGGDEEGGVVIGRACERKSV